MRLKYLITNQLSGHVIVSPIKQSIQRTLILLFLSFKLVGLLYTYYSISWLVMKYWQMLFPLHLIELSGRKCLRHINPALLFEGCSFCVLLTVALMLYIIVLWSLEKIIKCCKKKKKLKKCKGLILP